MDQVATEPKYIGWNCGIVQFRLDYKPTLRTLGPHMVGWDARGLEIKEPKLWGLMSSLQFNSQCLEVSSVLQLFFCG